MHSKNVPTQVSFLTLNFRVGFVARAFSGFGLERKKKEEAEKEHKNAEEHSSEEVHEQNRCFHTINI